MIGGLTLEGLLSTGGGGQVSFLAMHLLRYGSQTFLHTTSNSDLGLDANKHEKRSIQAK